MSNKDAQGGKLLHPLKSPIGQLMGEILDATKELNRSSIQGHDKKRKTAKDMVALATLKIPDDFMLPNGAEDLAKLRTSDFMATKEDWERLGIKKGFLPNAVHTEVIDQEEVEFPSFMNCHGITYPDDDPTNLKLIKDIQGTSPDIVPELQKMIYDRFAGAVDLSMIMSTEQEESTLYGSVAYQRFRITLTNRALDSGSIIEKNLSDINNMVIRSLDDVMRAEKQSKIWLTLYRWTSGSDDALPPNSFGRRSRG